ncbi:hypothetical protein Pmar_PMAR006984 [Perkinsus marinus ATCC 50983]|uniref:Uncharacterized protein n=1 Tax=Perkinsus marinus (strain ATCC 50983 / TXsc) TaxID=423536 RepID=C5KJZ4_PERM5|nr:hypothetical protein Pmar_PMAR006984 [Perkinsus marinus ATCC 50983]EER15252.1 hypothetical protein Pmar_PMAR006984 [Perkinsus marinus ATCC 50983]|eukprot:XP_002783456.1 hypothetical protein Pmar_PMAR006984 [Perkinsus marinus ATCC 50983]
MTFIGRIREAIPVNKQIVQSRITGLAEDCRRQLTHLQETALDTFKVASATFESIPCYLDVNVHVAFNPDNRLIGGVIRAKEKLITITTRGLDKTIGENRRKVVIERGAEVCHVLMGYTKGFLPALGGPSTSAEGH